MDSSRQYLLNALTSRRGANYSGRGGGAAEGTSRGKSATKNIATATRIENAGKKMGNIISGANMGVSLERGNVHIGVL